MSAVTIQGIAAGGAGVGRLADGMTVFVPRTAPGDQVELDIVQRRRRYARALVRHQAVAGPARVRPACPHYVADGCGGCQLQHLGAEAQLEAKRRIVGDALRRIGRRDVPDPVIVAAPAAWRYRSRVTLAAAGGRIGFHRFDHPNRVFELEDCVITRERVMALWRRIAAHRQLLPPSLTSILLQEDRQGQFHVVVAGAAERVWDATPLAEALGDLPVHIWWRPPRGAPRVVAGPVRGFPAGAFEQVYPEFAGRIRGDAVAALGEVAGRVVWDLYAGVGETAALLAERGAAVWSVEADRRAVSWARSHTPAPAAPGAVHLVAGRVEESLHRLPAPDAVVVNPPREGLAPGVTRALEVWAAQRAEGRVSYVSCDPATLARDLGRVPSLGLATITAYDLFPQTSHVEVLVVLEAA
jgi:23S rRNA (uracil1939-C5)-methyltransferase